VLRVSSVLRGSELLPDALCVVFALVAIASSAAGQSHLWSKRFGALG
jgi:hypothetical protein